MRLIKGPESRFSHRGLTAVLVVLLVFPVIACFNPLSVVFPPDTPVVYEEDVDSDSATGTWYVAPWGLDSNRGSRVKPLKTIQVAVNYIRSNFRNDKVNAFRIYVAGGTYTPGAGLMSEGDFGIWLDYRNMDEKHFLQPVTLSFGWDRLFLGQSDQTPSILDGEERFVAVMEIVNSSPDEPFVFEGFYTILGDSAGGNE